MREKRSILSLWKLGTEADRAWSRWLLENMCSISFGSGRRTEAAAADMSNDLFDF